MGIGYKGLVKRVRISVGGDMRLDTIILTNMYTHRGVTVTPRLVSIDEDRQVEVEGATEDVSNNLYKVFTDT